MRWIAISGTWRITGEQVEKDVRKAATKILQDGNGIVTGGALNVDYFATDEVLKRDPKADRIKIFLPTTFKIYSTHYRKRAEEGVITTQQAEALIKQLHEVKKRNSHAIVENKMNMIVERSTYYERNQYIIDMADELYAFQVNKSEGVKDAIHKANKKQIPVTLFSYTFS